MIRLCPECRRHYDVRHYPARCPVCAHDRATGVLLAQIRRLKSIRDTETWLARIGQSL